MKKYYSLFILFFIAISCYKQDVVPPTVEKYNIPDNDLTEWFNGEYELVHYWISTDLDTLPSPGPHLINYLESVDGDTIENMDLDDNQKITHSLYYDMNNNGIMDDINWFGDMVYKNPRLRSFERHSCYSSGWTVDYLSSIIWIAGQTYNVDYTIPYNAILIRGYWDDIGSSYCDGNYNSITIHVDQLNSNVKLSLVYTKIP